MTQRPDTLPTYAVAARRQAGLECDIIGGGTSSKPGLPVAIGRSDVIRVKCSDEHDVVADPGTDLKVNDRPGLVPGQSGWTCNVHDWKVGFRNGCVETLWPVSARGNAC